MPSAKQILGAAEEARAERALAAAGYVVVERNWRGAGAELDRVAWDGDVLVVIEIRARRGAAHGRPEATIGPAKQRRVVRGAIAYLSRFPPARTPSMRFDVVAVRGDEVRIIRDAFVVDPRWCDVPNL